MESTSNRPLLPSFLFFFFFPSSPTRCYFTALGELARFARCKNLLPSSYLIRINAESRVTASNVFTRDETSVIWSWRVVDGNEVFCLATRNAVYPDGNLPRIFPPLLLPRDIVCPRLVSRGLIIFLPLWDAFLLRYAISALVKRWKGESGVGEWVRSSSLSRVTSFIYRKRLMNNLLSIHSPDFIEV